MTQHAISNRLAWDDRWVQPNLEQLLEPLKVQPKRLFNQLLGQLATLGQVESTIIWYGASWKWTICYSLRDAKGKEIEPLCYLVPNHQNPLVCVPLSDAVIERLPLKKLHRFVRDGIAGAKCAVSIHWAIWSPGTLAETAFLFDVIERKHAILIAPPGSRPAHGKGSREEMDEADEIEKKAAKAAKKEKAAKALKARQEEAGIQNEKPAPAPKAAKPEKPAKVAKAAKPAKPAKHPQPVKPAKVAKAAKPAAKPAKAEKSKPAKGKKQAKGGK